MAFIGMRVNREGGFARSLRILGRNAISQDLALKRARKRCKLSGGKSLFCVPKRPKTRYRRPVRRQRPVLAAKPRSLT